MHNTLTPKNFCRTHTLTLGSKGVFHLDTIKRCVLACRKRRWKFEHSSSVWSPEKIRSIFLHPDDVTFPLFFTSSCLKAPCPQMRTITLPSIQAKNSGNPSSVRSYHHTDPCRNESCIQKLVPRKILRHRKALAKYRRKQPCLSKDIVTQYFKWCFRKALHIPRFGRQQLRPLQVLH